jgi:hypothetical protein
VVTNALPRFGVHYLIASAAGSGSSMFLSIITNFLWIWRKPAAEPVDRHSPGQGIVEATNGD